MMGVRAMDRHVASGLSADVSVPCVFVSLWALRDSSVWVSGLLVFHVPGFSFVEVSRIRPKNKVQKVSKRGGLVYD